MKTITNSLEETLKFGVSLFKRLKAGDVIAMTGDLGAGKTSLVQGIVKEAGVSRKNYVNSPTFTILNIYEGGKFPIYHFDWYRLSSEGEAYDIGVEEYLNGKGICLIEWAEKFPKLLPERAIWVKMSVLSDDVRKIEVENL